MIHTVIMLAFWSVALPVAALVGFPSTFITRDITLFFRMVMWGMKTSVWLAGVRLETEGLEKLDPSKTYIFMSNHTSNLDPPILLPLIPKRTFDGKLLPFKKGPFYLAVECAVPVVPVTIVNTNLIMPKARFGITPGTAQVIFHDPIPPSEFGGRDRLMERVWNVINESLPPGQQGSYRKPTEVDAREAARTPVS